MKNNKQKKSKLKSILVILILLMIIVLLVILWKFYVKYSNPEENGTIIATKIERINESDVEIEYKIKIRDHKYGEITKQLKFKNEELAKSEYDYYQRLNEIESRNIGTELKGKKLILTMPVIQFLQDIEYNREEILKMAAEEDYEIEQVYLKEIKDLLIDQGYTVQ